jgi:hypothetical protein
MHWQKEYKRQLYFQCHYGAAGIQDAMAKKGIGTFQRKIQKIQFLMGSKKKKQKDKAR